MKLIELRPEDAPHATPGPRVRWQRRMRGEADVLYWKKFRQGWAVVARRRLIMKLRCYCCGEPVDKNIVLVSMSDNVDRVFVMLPRHAKLAMNVLTRPVVDDDLIRS